MLYSTDTRHHSYLTNGAVKKQSRESFNSYAALLAKFAMIISSLNRGIYRVLRNKLYEHVRIRMIDKQWARRFIVQKGTT